jgi:hypothetical protein
MSVNIGQSQKTKGKDIYVSPLPPSKPQEGDLWFNTVENRLYQYVSK